MENIAVLHPGCVYLQSHPEPCKAKEEPCYKIAPNFGVLAGKNDAEWDTFCKKHGFNPFVIDENTIDLDSGLIDELVETFRNGGYDKAFPLVVANSDDPTVQGEMVDGKHRVVACYRLFKRGIPVRPFPPIVFEDIPDRDTLKCRIAHYIQKSRSKDGRFARRLVEKNLKEVIESRLDKFGDRLPQEVLRMGFHSSTVVVRLMGEVRERRQKKELKGARRGSKIPLDFEAGQDSDWGISKRYPNEPINAKPGETDGITTFRACPCGCKPPKELMIKTAIDGSVLEIKRAEVVNSG